MEKKMFATRIDKRILRNLKLLSAYTDQPINTLLEEAVQDLFQKYEKKIPKSSALYELAESPMPDEGQNDDGWEDAEEKKR